MITILRLGLALVYCTFGTFGMIALLDYARWLLEQN